MAGIVHMVMRLLLLSLITTGVDGGDGLMFAERAHDITVPCEEDLVCFHIWQLNTSHASDYIAIVGNGAIQAPTPEGEDSKCTLQIKEPTAEDVGRHGCQTPDVFSHTSPEWNLTPGQTLSLQCILLSSVERNRYTRLHRVRLSWVDEAGAAIQEDAQHQLQRESPRDVTLTVTFQSPANEKFRCQATAGEEVQTSVELLVRVPALKGKGRGILIELEAGDQGGNQDTIGAAVGVVGCVVLAALVALFLVNRRRTRSQLPDESCHTTSTNDVVDADDVVYADIIIQLPDESCHTTSTNDVVDADDVVYADIIILPVDPDRVRVHECESTEYASVRYK